MDIILETIDLLMQILKKRKESYNSWLRQSPAGGLTRDNHRIPPIFLHIVPDGIYPSGQIRYRRRVLDENCELLKQLALKEYLRVALKTLDHNIRCLQRARDDLLSFTFEDIRGQMRSSYKDVSDTILSSAFYQEYLPEGVRLPQHDWAARPFQQSDYRPEEKTHITSRGLAVRSRAELLIAEMLYRYDIPFRYEQVIRAGRYELAPDFTFLGADGKEFYWEYCGMMADPGYRKRQLWRRGTYEGIGITEWENMIYTYDVGDSIDMREIEAIIRSRILPRMQG